MKSNSVGTVNFLKKQESIAQLEILIKMYKKNKIKTDTFIKQMNENMINLTMNRDYVEYLRNIGQL